MAGGRDPGLELAIAAAGGRWALARALGLRQRPDWARVPQMRLMEVARVTGLTPEQLRPDLAGWIAAEAARRRLALARERFALASAAAPPSKTPPSPAAEAVVVVDILVALAAARFVAAREGMALLPLLVSRRRADSAARALAMALAHVAGRASSTVIGDLYGCSHQNVENAAERYLRARDGDDEEDIIELGGVARVIERGRLRRAKSAAELLWDLETQFAAILAGEGRKRA